MTGSIPTEGAVDPDRQQRRASDPGASVWVGASAGSGKTKVLTDRVLRLLLSGTPPQRLLCLTFTKAAAAEMANRVNRSLGEWATSPDAALREKLAGLTGTRPSDAEVGAARRLFARVLDVPGGLKIQTIHSFCESLLGRFPIEAGVPPHFQVMDERSASEMLRTARDDVLAAALGEDDSRAALETLTAYLHEDRFSALLQGLLMQRGRLRWLIGEGGSLAAARDRVYRALDIDADATKVGLVAAACRDGAFDRDGLKAAAEALLDGTKSFQPRGRLLADWLAADDEGRARQFEAYVRVFLTGDFAIYKSLLDKKASDRHPAAIAVLQREAERVSAVKEQCRTAATAEATSALLQLGGAMLRAYARAKSLRVQFDYDDLIYKARDLLRADRDGFAAWVLFKLDGGLDHILIDEAQDTNPDQWEVVAAMADEFFAGMGARDVDRTIFAVGDTKQSIFSFQRAEPAFFRAFREYFEKRTSDAGKGWDTVDLDISFRSAPSVLRAVDAVFATGPARQGVVESGEALQHKAYRAEQAGLVEVWPAVGPEEEEEAEWQPPVRRRDRLAPEVRLAKLVTQKLCGWIGREPLPSHGRAVRAGDVMILLRRRSGFMETLVRELKSAGVPVAGVDRMALTEQLAVMDLVALGRFLLLPEDDLTLAVVLKGPFIGFDDDNDLFPLCHDRGAASVWRRLGDMAAGSARFARAHAWLSGLLAGADQSPPFELFAHVLGGATAAGPTGWQALLSRLGPEAEDPVDEFLTLALGYERSHVPSLQGFLHWLEAGSAEIKRDLEQTGRDEVRVMTVHGAKGLQSPVVILPDTMALPQQSQEIVWREDVPLWPPGRANENATCCRLREEAKARDEEEHRRLLYVAMTRAEDRLYVCGWHGPRQPSAECWYSLVQQGLAGIAEPRGFDFAADIGAAGWSGEGLRLANAQTGEPDMAGTRTVGRETAPRSEAWMGRPPKPDPMPPRPLAPSRPITAEPAALSPLAGTSGDRFHRGIVIHRLLQVLPDLPAEGRERACRSYLARPAHGFSREEQAEIAAEVLAAIATPDFADLFGPHSMAEVPVIGTIAGPDGPEVVSGQVDRLVVRDDGIMVLDYKTSRPPPETPDRVAPAYLRQMAAYRAVLRALWPDRPVSCALLWTAVPRLMALDNRLLDRYRPAT
jgi:ATP-dependent helicase/nuclease subunit A